MTDLSGFTCMQGPGGGDGARRALGAPGEVVHDVADAVIVVLAREGRPTVDGHPKDLAAHVVAYWPL